MVLPMLMAAAALLTVSAVRKTPSGADALPVGTSRLFNVEGRTYRVTRVGAGIYRVELLSSVGVVASVLFGQSGPPVTSGPKDVVDNFLLKDIHKLPLSGPVDQATAIAQSALGTKDPTTIKATADVLEQGGYSALAAALRKAAA